MTPGEVDAIERVTGLTFQKIRRLGDQCVCDHPSGTHVHRDAEGVQTADTSCTAAGCSCDAHSADLPMRISTAFAWVSIRRQMPAVTFQEVSDTPLSELEDEDAPAVDVVDPTVPPAEVSPT